VRKTTVIVNSIPGFLDPWNHRERHFPLQGEIPRTTILVGPPFSYYSHKNPLKSGNGREAYWEGGPGPLGVTGEIPPELVKDFSISMSSSEILTIQPEAGYCSLIWNPDLESLYGSR